MIVGNDQDPNKEVDMMITLSTTNDADRELCTINRSFFTIHPGGTAAKYSPYRSSIVFCSNITDYSRDNRNSAKYR